MRIYLSSTLNDLKPERAAVKEALSGFHTVVESYDADEKSVSASCVADVKGCGLYIAIVGLRYGFIPPGESKSITELEFEAAGAAGMKRLVFLKDPAAVSAPDTDAITGEHDKKWIDDFRARLSSGAPGIPRPAVFSSAEDLKQKLLRKLMRWIEADRSDLSTLDGTALARLSDIASGVASEPPPSASGLQLDDEPLDATVLQRRLRRYLTEHWREIHAHPLFLSAEVVRDCATPLSVQGVYEAVVGADCEGVLEGLRPCFGAASVDRSSPAYEAIQRIALVAAEQFILAQREELGPVCGEAHEPIPGQDPVLAGVLAAALFRFGLHFTGDNRLPANVLYAKPPQAELWNPGEEGPALYRKEFVAMANRLEFGSEHDVSGMEDISDRRLSRMIRKLSERLDCPIALSTAATDAFSTADERKRLVEDMRRIGVRAFFRPSEHVVQPHSVLALLADLKVLLMPFFFHSVPANEADKEASQVTKESPSSNSTININFHGPVGTVAQANAPNAIAAARDVVHNVHDPVPADLLKELAAVVGANLALQAVPARSAEFRGYIEDIQAVVEKEPDKRTPSEARLVKRCLSGLEEGAKAVENGSAILEKLAPLWDGLKASWPALAALFS